MNAKLKNRNLRNRIAWRAGLHIGPMFLKGAIASRHLWSHTHAQD